MPRSVTDPQVKPEAVLDLLNQLGCFGMVLQVEQVLPDDKVNMGGQVLFPAPAQRERGKAGGCSNGAGWTVCCGGPWQRAAQIRGYEQCISQALHPWHQRLWFCPVGSKLLRPTSVSI